MGRSTTTHVDVTIAIAVLVSFTAMELVSYSLHRWVMHGFGVRWHRSHHRISHHGLEPNDRFPLVMAAVAIVLFAASGGTESLVFWCAAGVTLYGMVYLFVHDVYIHRRLRVPLPRVTALEVLRRRHALHHDGGDEPYGMLLPWTVRELARRSMRASRPRL